MGITLRLDCRSIISRVIQSLRICILSSIFNGLPRRFSSEQIRLEKSVSSVFCFLNHPLNILWKRFKYSRHHYRERLLSNNQFTSISVRFIPSVGVLISGNVRHTFKNYCGESKTRTCNLKAMTLASYQLLHFAV